VIWFNHLDMDVIHQVVDKFIVELQAQLDVKGVSLEVTSAARNWLLLLRLRAGTTKPTKQRV